MSSSMYSTKVPVFWPESFTTLHQDARALSIEVTQAGIRSGHSSKISSILAPAKDKLEAANLRLSNHIWSFEMHQNEERDGDRGKIEDNIDKAMMEVSRRKAVVITLEMAVLKALQTIGKDY